MKKTKNLITKILLESGGRLNLSQIMKKMQDEDHIITDDTLAKNLQEMTKSGYLRYEKEKEEVEYYSYNLSKENRLK
jgi:DNA-binding HxlR family transcriptional regulator